MASATLAERSGPGLQVGTVISRAMSLWGKLAVPFSLVFLLQTLPRMVVSASASPGSNPTNVGLAVIIATLLGGIISIAVNGAGFVATSRAAQGEQVQVMACIQAAMGRFFALFGTWFCAGLVIMAGMILLVVPGLIAAVALYVCGPVCVLEGLGPVESLKRTAALTKGSRWRLFGLAVVVGLLGIIVALAGLAARAVLGLVLGSVVEAVVSAAIGLFGVVVMTLAYRDLVDGTEGFGGNRMAQVFD